MQQEIGYKGYTTQPSDRACQDGDMALSLGMVNEDGGLRAVFPPDGCFLHPLPDGWRVIHQHRTSAYRHIIVQSSGSSHAVKWFDRDNVTYDTYQTGSYIHLESITIPNAFNEALKVESMGNTLVMLTESGMQYFLWKEGGYTYLGDHLPELSMSFGLQGTRRYGNVFTIPFNNNQSEGFVFYNSYIVGSAGRKLFSSINIPNDKMELIKQHFAKHVISRVNKYIAMTREKGRFLFPFFVRYAYRMYDGTLTMHSPAILMIPSTYIAPTVTLDSVQTDSNNYVTSITSIIAAIECDLDYICSASSKTNLLRWLDIVKSVDIFISTPIYTYDQNGDVEGTEVPESSDWFDETDYGKLLEYYKQDYGVMKMNTNVEKEDNHPNPPTITEDMSQVYNRWRASSLLYQNARQKRFILPRHNEKSIIQTVRDTSIFRLVASIKIEDLQTEEREIIDIPKYYLNSLDSREAMTDDYLSHDQLSANFIDTYNNRLHIANVKRKIAKPMCLQSYYPICDGGYDYNSENYGWGTNTGSCTYDLYVYIRNVDVDTIIKAESTSIFGNSSPFLFFYYPDPDAYKIVIVKTDTRTEPSTTTCYEIPLESSSFLSGAFYFAGWSPVLPKMTTVDLPTEVGSRDKLLSNKLYVSEVDNPFFFPNEKAINIGTGKIVSLSIATKALSEGQFGQFPLYAFCSDGIWALTVSSTGGYSSVHPIPRDVCTNPESITQLDDAVLFASARGIMVLSGSRSACISDEIFAERPFDVTRLPGMEQLHGMVDGGQDACVPTGALLEFVSGCRMIYDYVRQRVVVYNPTMVNTAAQGQTAVYRRKYTYAYVWSLKSKMWGMMRTDIAYGINSYPEALAVNDSNEIVSFTSSDAVTVKGLAVTRPLTLGARDVLKSVHTLIQRGMFRKGTVKTVLWGSRDLQNWVLVDSSTTEELRHMRGSGYKWFRIGVLAELKEEETVEGATVEIEARQTNVLR